MTISGRHILLVEDDFLIAGDFAAALQAAGAMVVGPVASVSEAQDLIARTERLDGAVIDIHLKGELSYPVADALMARRIPVVFATGYDRDSVPERYAGIVLCEKPVDPTRCAEAMFG